MLPDLPHGDPDRPTPPSVPRPRGAEADVRAHLEELAAADPVTGLPARLRTQGLLEVATWNARTGGTVLGVLAVQLEGVDDVVERFGLAAADDVLRSAAQRLRARLRHGDVLGRLGPHRFAVGLPELAPDTAARAAARIADVLADAVGAPFVVAGEQVVLGVRVGTALCPADADDVAGLLGVAVAGENSVRR